MSIACSSFRVGVIAAFGLLTAASSASAAYQINVRAQTGGLNDAFGFYPNMTVTENGGATTSKVTLSSPGNQFEGYHNFPASSSSVEVVSSAQVVSKANGTWTVKIETVEQTPKIYQYTVNAALALPFATLPNIVSADMVNGSTFDGTVNFGLINGSATYPGPASTVRARLYNKVTNELLETDILPHGTTAWTPGTSMAGLSQIRIILDTQDEAVDASSFTLTNVTPLDPAASPGLNFNLHNLTYTAYREAVLVVPEPGSLATMLLAGSVMRRRRV